MTFLKEERIIIIILVTSVIVQYDNRKINKKIKKIILKHCKLQDFYPECKIHSFRFKTKARFQNIISFEIHK